MSELRYLTGSPTDVRAVRIRKGARRPSGLCPNVHAPILRKVNTIHVAFRFSSNVQWNYREPDGVGNNLQLNKLCGVSYGLLGHHKNSLRVAWCWNPGTNKIEIYRYEYVDGQRQIKLCMRCKPNKNYHLVLGWHGEPTLAYYELGPYFGGELKAPHTHIFAYSLAVG